MSKTIRKNENFGGVLELDDGSRCKVSPLDKNKAGMWAILDSISIDSGLLGKHQLTNIKRQETIEAQLIR